MRRCPSTFLAAVAPCMRGPNTVPAMSFVGNWLGVAALVAFLGAYAVPMAVGRGSGRFVPLVCINIVVAANAVGAFSPFGDITTLMVWQAGRVPFAGFFGLLLPSLVNWLVPALLLSTAIRGRPVRSDTGQPDLEPGAIAVLGLSFQESC